VITQDQVAHEMGKPASDISLQCDECGVEHQSAVVEFNCDGGVYLHLCYACVAQAIRDFEGLALSDA
jgi:hypothetical protein